MDRVETYRFDAFLSYATRSDYHLVRRLKTFLETVHRLKGASGPPLRKLEICTDEGDFTLRALGQSEGIGGLLDTYLAQSRFLVVLCSPDAAASQWVDHEVKWFLERRGPGAILLVVTKGDPVRNPHSVFPPSVIEAKLHESLSWYDFRGASGRQKGIAPADVARDFTEQRLRLAADLLGRSSSELQPLWYRDQQRQHRRRIASLSAISVVLAVLALAAMYAWSVAKQQRELAETRERTATSRGLAMQALTQIDVEPEQALLLALASRELAPTLESESALLAALMERPRLHRVLHRDATMIMCVASSPSGQRIAAGTFDGRVLQFDRRTGQMAGRPLQGHYDLVTSLVFASEDTLVSAGNDGRIIVWDATTGKQRAFFNGPATADGVLALAVAPGGRMLAAGTRNGIIHLWTLPDLHQLDPSLAAAGVISLAFDRVGRVLISASMDDGVRLWNVVDGRVIRKLPVHRSLGKFALALAPDGRHLAVSGETGTLELWNLNEPHAKAAVLRGHRGDVSTLAFSPDSAQLAAGDEQNITLWNTESQTKVRADNLGHSDVVMSLQFTSDGKLLVSGSADGSVILWNVTDSDAIGVQLGTHRGEGTAVAFSHDGRYVASGGDDGNVRLRSISGKDIRAFHVAAPIRELAFSHDGIRLAAANDAGMVVWMVVTGTVAGTLELPDAEHVLFTSDDRTIAVSRRDGWIAFWDVATRHTRAEVQRQDAESTSNLVLSEDGRQLLQALFSTFGLAEMPTYAADSGKQIGTFPAAFSRGVTSLAISRDGSLLAAGGTGPIIRLWDFRSRKQLRQLLGLKTNVYGLQFGPQRRLVSAGNEGVWLWDVDSGARIGRRLFRNLTQSVAFSSDGTHVAAANMDGSIWMWDLRPELWRRVACRVANRNLTVAEWRAFVRDRPYVAACSRDSFLE